MTIHVRVVALAALASIAGIRTVAQRSGEGTAPFQLPDPSGTHQVGTATWRLTDPSRAETFSATDERRQVEVQAWYPATASTGEPAPYLRSGLVEVQGFATLLRGPKTAYDDLAAVRVHAKLNGPLASAPQRFPLLVFSHGYGGFASAYTGLLEDLASHGYVVLSIVHPYEVGAATLTDGRVVSFVDEAGALRQGYRDVIGEWGREDETMAAVTRTVNVDEQRRLLRGYLSGLHNTGNALRRWVGDTKLVLDKLATLPSTGMGGRLASRVDANRVGLFGHSMGGVTAAQFCLDDRRCVGALNLDGIPQYGNMIDRSLKRPFLMVYSARPGRTGASDPIYKRAASPYYRIDVQNTLHLDFCDMNFWGGPLRERGAFGSIEPARAAEITRTIVRQYFDQVLNGQRSSLLAGQSSFPEVTVNPTAK
jgi:dienelactone hydrolase